VANDLEVTLEANPTSVEAGRFAGYAQAGVNRVSLGVQALNDGDLRRLGRLHNAAEAMEAYEIARKFFDRTSFDLIYARQDQSLAAWRDELHRALDLAVDHLSRHRLWRAPCGRNAARAARGRCCRRYVSGNAGDLRGGGA
jgi:oxygen-independent coproporphyrinogen-3 oxidase